MAMMAIVDMRVVSYRTKIRGRCIHVEGHRQHGRSGRGVHGGLCV